MSVQKLLWLVCAASLTAACGCAFQRGHDQTDDQMSPQAQDEQPDYMDDGAFPKDPDYPQNR